MFGPSWGLWFQYKCSFQSLCSAIQICRVCVPPSGQSGAWAAACPRAVLLKVHGVLFKVRSSYVQHGGDCGSPHTTSQGSYLEFLSLPDCPGTFWLSGAPFTVLKPVTWGCHGAPAEFQPPCPRGHTGCEMLPCSQGEAQAADSCGARLPRILGTRGWCLGAKAYGLWFLTSFCRSSVSVGPPRPGTRSAPVLEWSLTSGGRTPSSLY